MLFYVILFYLFRLHCMFHVDRVSSATALFPTVRGALHNWPEKNCCGCESQVRSCFDW